MNISTDPAWFRILVVYEVERAGLPDELFLPARPVVGDVICFTTDRPVNDDGVLSHRYRVVEVSLFAVTKEQIGKLHQTIDGPYLRAWLAEWKEG